jgi:N-acetylglucosamine-6-phosphate deacetylase
MADQLGIRNGQLVLPDGRITGADLLIRDGRIEEIGPGLRAPKEIDASGCYVLPGLIDLHAHGMAGVGADGDLAELCRRQLERGATTFYPTFYHRAEEAAELMRRHRKETDELRAVPQAAGFRLEMPYLADDGGPGPHSVFAISDDVTSMLLDAGGGHVRIWDISPELGRATETISRLASQRIICSIAHTHCTVEQCRTAVEAGARLATHLFDVFFQPEVQDADAGVYPAGVVDYLLIEDRVVAEIIGDGTHVAPMLVEQAFRCKTPERLAFITDSSEASGMPPGRYTFFGHEVICTNPNEGARDADSGYLAGSAMTAMDSLRNIVRLFGKSLGVAAQVCAATHARLMGLNKGEIAPGKDADLIVVDRQLNLLHTIGGGRVLWQCLADTCDS